MTLSAADSQNTFLLAIVFYLREVRVRETLQAAEEEEEEGSFPDAHSTESPSLQDAILSPSPSHKAIPPPSVWRRPFSSSAPLSPPSAFSLPPPPFSYAERKEKKSCRGDEKDDDELSSRMFVFFFSVTSRLVEWSAVQNNILSYLDTGSSQTHEEILVGIRLYRVKLSSCRWINNIKTFLTW